MRSLADIYLSRFPHAEEHGSEINGPCPFCGDTSGPGHRSDRFVVFRDKTDKLGKVCGEHNIPGFWWCRQCNKGGDSLDYLIQAEGMEFKEACAELGIMLDGKNYKRREAEAPRVKKEEEFTGKERKTPEEQWSEHISKLDKECREALKNQRGALQWLEERGIDLETAQKYGLGFLTGENGKDVRFRYRSAFGLAESAGKDGKPCKVIAMRRGITIPSYGKGGKVTMFRVRRPRPDVKEGQGKYWEMPGGSHEPYFLPSKGGESVKVVIVTESELDAILLHRLGGGKISVAAMRSVSNRPDEALNGVLRRADSVLFAMDSDEAGANAYKWWAENYGAVHTPIPGYKDPGEAYKGGLDLAMWLASIMPPTMRLESSGIMRGKKEEKAQEADKTGNAPKAAWYDSLERLDMEDIQPAAPEECAFLFNNRHDIEELEKALPEYLTLGQTPLDVQALWLMWRDVPVWIEEKHLRVPEYWRDKHRQQWQRMYNLFIWSYEIKEWLWVHNGNMITRDNWLLVYGE